MMCTLLLSVRRDDMRAVPPPSGPKETYTISSFAHPLERNKGPTPDDDCLADPCNQSWVVAIRGLSRGSLVNQFCRRKVSRAGCARGTQLESRTRGGEPVELRAERWEDASRVKHGVPWIYRVPLAQASR